MSGMYSLTLHLVYSRQKFYGVILRKDKNGPDYQSGPF